MDQVQAPHSLVRVPAQLGLGKGEWEAISLALEIAPRYLVMDDREPVEFARSLGISVLTTPSLLVMAKRAGLIDTVKDRLNGLRQTGFWLKERSYREILRDCGEADIR